MEERNRNTDAYLGVEAVAVVSKSAWARELTGEAMAESAKSIRCALTIRRIVLRWETRTSDKIRESLAPILTNMGHGGRGSCWWWTSPM